MWLVLPLGASGRSLVAAVPGCALAAVGLQLAGSPEAAGFFKLGATAALGFWLLVFFERLSWVVLVACIVPWVDAYSVWRGPTHEIVKHRAHVFEALSVPFPLPGGAVANLGLPDLLFFALFLGAAARFRPAPRLDMALPRRLARDHDRADRRLRHLGPAGVARPRARLPRAERRPGLARAAASGAAR